MRFFTFADVTPNTVDMQIENVLLTANYFGPIQYYSKILGYSNVIIEQHENYQKQSFRNRCQILSANGLQSLTVPVVKPNGNHTLIRDVLVDYSTPWQRIHQKAIESAYRTAAYYQHYIDELIPAFEKKEKYLFDLNIKSHSIVMELMGVNHPLSYTSTFDKTPPSHTIDFRNRIHPKRESNDETFCEVSYFQVFSDRFSFVANLSIIDLLLNMGPDSANIIKKCIKQ